MDQGARMHQAQQVVPPIQSKQGKDNNAMVNIEKKSIPQVGTQSMTENNTPNPHFDKIKVRI